MDEVKQQIIEKLQNANNILVTVSANPTVDQLSACLGLTLLLNKMDKHATAVFSGKVPSTIEFLKPEDTLETTTDSLRDFIISLDKSKADKLRYKVEDEVVKIFITPYKSSISEKDLVFSQGDFNVDVVVALGVHEPQDLDNAITAHGRILHDAAVICVNASANGGELGGINWIEPGASGLAELVTGLATSLGPNILDAQIATALLTGIVAQTEHFSNQRTQPATMTASATLLAAGANQQLVSKELAPKPVAAPAPKPAPADAPADPAPAKPEESNDGELDVPHTPDEKPAKKPAKSAGEKPADKPQAAPAPAPKVPDVMPPLLPEKPSIDPDEKLAQRIKRIEPLPHEEPEAEVPKAKEEPKAPEPPKAPDAPEMAPATLITPEPAAPAEPAAPITRPVLNDDSDDSLDAILGQANSTPAQPATPVLPTPNPIPNAPVIEVPPAPEAAEPANPTVPSPESAPKPADKPPLIPMPAPTAPSTQPPAGPQPAAPAAPEDKAAPAAETKDESLSALEESVHSPHAEEPVIPAESDVDSARKAVEDALKSLPDQHVEPLAAVGAVNVDLDLGHDETANPAVPETQPGPGVPAMQPADGIPGYLQTPSMTPAPDGNAAAANMPPFEDLPSTPPPVGLNIAPPPQVIAPTNSPLPPQGPPPPPTPPPMT